MAASALSIFTINDIVVTNNSRIVLPIDTTFVTVLAIPAVESTVIDISGDTNLQPGKNIVTVKATGTGINETYTVYLYVRSSSQTRAEWFTLGGDIDGQLQGDQLGYSLAMTPSGRTIVGGAPYSKNGSNIPTGAVCVYDWNGITWTQRGATLYGDISGDQYGFTVAISDEGNIIAIGAPFNDGDSGTITDNRGKVYIYSWDTSGGWTPLGSAIGGIPDTPGAGNVSIQSGISISLSGDGSRIAFGARYKDGGGTDRGQTTVYSWDGTVWALLGSAINGEANFDYSGWHVYLSKPGDTVAIAAPYNDGSGNSSGHVRVYDFNGTNWVQRGADINGPAANTFTGFDTGVSMSYDTNRIVIGMPDYDITNPPSGVVGTNDGLVRVLEWNGESWIQLGQDVLGDVYSTSSRFGSGAYLSWDGNTFAAGEYGYDISGGIGNIGRTRIFDLSGDTWIQRGATLVGETSNSGGTDSGRSISLSFNGNIVAIGAPRNDGTSTDTNYNVGHIRVYEYRYLSDTTTLSTFTINGTDALINNTVTIPYGATSVNVTAIPADPLAQITITGQSGLVIGNNLVTVRVTAEDGTTQDYDVSLNMAPSLSSLTLKDISAGYLMIIQQANKSSLYGLLMSQESAIRAAIQARIEEICSELPQLLYNAAAVNIPYVTIFCILRTDHRGLCADGSVRDTNSEAFERYLKIDVSGSTVQEILTGRISSTLTVSTITAVSLSPSAYDGSFMRCFKIAWPAVTI